MFFDLDLLKSWNNLKSRRLKSRKRGLMNLVRSKMLCEALLKSVIDMMSSGKVPEDEAEEFIYNVSIMINDYDYMIEYYN